MKPRIFDPNRREVLAGLGASAAGLMAGGAGPLLTAQLALQARPATLALRPGQPATPIWELAAASHLGNVRLKRGDRCEMVFRNDLPVPLAPVWYGLDGPAAAGPARGTRAHGAGRDRNINYFNTKRGNPACRLPSLEDRLNQPARPLPIIAAETSPVANDRDVVL